VAKICFITNYASHYHLAKWQLMASTFNIDFVFDDDVTKAKGVKQMDLSQINAKTLKVRNYFFKDHMIWQRGVVKLAFKGEYDKYIVTEEVTCISSWIMALIVKFNKKKKFFRGDGHGWYGREGFIKRLIKKTAFKLSDGEFVYGSYAKNIMIDNGLDENKIWVVHNSLNHAEQLIYRNTFSDIYKSHFRNDYPVLLFVGRLISSKRLEMILSAIEILKNDCFECNCIIIGDGEIKKELVEMTKNKKIENNIWFYGASYSEPELSKLITNADLCVSPGNIGLTAIHSLTYGTPVITSDDFKNQGPEFEAIKSGMTGDFFKAGCVNDLSQKIKSWLLVQKNRDRVRKNCYDEIDKYWTPEFKINVFKNVLNN